MLKTRPDLMLESEQTVFDVKTTQDASPKGFLKECIKYGYFLQGAHYVYTCKLAGYDVKKFSFIACEKTAPYVSHLQLKQKVELVRMKSETDCWKHFQSLKKMISSPQLWETQVKIFNYLLQPEKSYQ